MYLELTSDGIGGCWTLPEKVPTTNVNLSMFLFQAHLEGIFGNLCGDIWQSGGTVIVGKGEEETHLRPGHATDGNTSGIHGLFYPCGQYFSNCLLKRHQGAHCHCIRRVYCSHSLPVSPLLPDGELILYFVQESPGDFLPLDTITKALGISANVVEEAKPEVRDPLLIAFGT